MNAKFKIGDKVWFGDELLTEGAVITSVTFTSANGPPTYKLEGGRYVEEEVLRGKTEQVDYVMWRVGLFLKKMGDKNPSEERKE